MNLQETIAELENQAAQYTEAANTLRALLEQEATGKVAAPAKAATKTAAQKVAKGAPRKARKKAGKKAAVSPETRAKISEALRASHAARKAQSE